jgi:hypothetical protein
MTEAVIKAMTEAVIKKLIKAEIKALVKVVINKILSSEKSVAGAEESVSMKKL